MTVIDIATAITLGLLANSLVQRGIDTLVEYVYLRRSRKGLENFIAAINFDEQKNTKKPVAKKTAKKSAKNVPLN